MHDPGLNFDLGDTIDSLRDAVRGLGLESLDLEPTLTAANEFLSEVGADEAGASGDEKLGHEIGRNLSKKPAARCLRGRYCGKPARETAGMSFSAFP